MNSKEICIWLDKRWCGALEDSTGKSVETLVQEQVDALVQQLPHALRESISSEIRQEEQRRAAEAEANRRFSVFRVAEHGEEQWFTASAQTNMLQAANALRRHSRGEVNDGGISRFSDMFTGREPISREQYEMFLAERLRDTGRVTGAFDIDLDKSEFAILGEEQRWHTFHTKDVSTAAYYAYKADHSTEERRTGKLRAHLEGKEIKQNKPVLIRGERELRPEDVSFSGDVVQDDGRLNFYMDAFNVDAVLGTCVCTDENDDWVNVYVDYDLEHGRVCDVLDVILVHADGSEMECAYRLSPAEQAALLPMMDRYCQEQMKRTLAEVWEQYLDETQGMQMGGMS